MNRQVLASHGAAEPDSPLYKIKRKRKRKDRASPTCAGATTAKSKRSRSLKFPLDKSGQQSPIQQELKCPSEEEILCPQTEEYQEEPVSYSTPPHPKTSLNTSKVKKKKPLTLTHSSHTSKSTDTLIDVLPVDPNNLNDFNEVQSIIDEDIPFSSQSHSLLQTPKKEHHQAGVISPTSQGFITPKRRLHLKKGGLDSPSILTIEALNRFSRDSSRLDSKKSLVCPLNFSQIKTDNPKLKFHEDVNLNERIYFSVEDEIQSTLDWDQLEEFLPFLEEYKNCQPRPVISLPQELRRMIDQHIFIIMGYSRTQINHFVELGFVGYYPKDVYFLPAVRLSDEQRRVERRKLESIMLEINSQIPSSPGVFIDLYALEDNIISPFEAWVKNHKKQGTQFSLDFETINLAIYHCLEDALSKDLYRINFLPEGYLHIYSPLLHKKWKNSLGESNKKLTRRKKSPVDLKGITLEAHHVAGDIMTDPDCYSEMVNFLKTGKSHTVLPIKELFRKACILLILSKEAHDRDIHPYPYNPNRSKFTKIREKGNTIIYGEHFSK